MDNNTQPITRKAGWRTAVLLFIGMFAFSRLAFWFGGTIAHGDWGRFAEVIAVYSLSLAGGVCVVAICIRRIIRGPSRIGWAILLVVALVYASEPVAALSGFASVVLHHGRAIRN